MPQRNPLLRHTQENESASTHANGQTEPQATLPTSQQANTSTSAPVSESAGKQADNKKPTKSYRLDRDLTFRFMLWARSHHMTESAALTELMERHLAEQEARP